MKKLFLLGFVFSACSDQEYLLNTSPRIISIQAPSHVSLNDTVFISTYDKESQSLTVDARVFTTDGNDVTGAFSKDFTDDGLDGDHVPNDGVFTGILDHGVLLAQTTSEFKLEFTLSETGKNSSDPVSIIILQNPAAGHPPVISNLVAPDTVHTAQVTEFLLTVAVSDPEGLSDIASVTRLNVTSGGPPRSLRDDGANGDVTGGDGIYTERVSVNPSPAAGNYVFRVQASDKLGLVSNSLEKIIVITP